RQTTAGDDRRGEEVLITALRTSHRAVRWLVLFAVGVASPASALAIGSRVPEFLFVPLDGPEFAFAEAARAHAATVVVFMSVLCPYSNYNEAHLTEIEHRYGARGVLMVGVDSNRMETAGEITAHARARGFTLPLMKDEGHRVADLLDARV